MLSSNRTDAIVRPGDLVTFRPDHLALLPVDPRGPVTTIRAAPVWVQIDPSSILLAISVHDDGQDAWANVLHRSILGWVLLFSLQRVSP